MKKIILAFFCLTSLFSCKKEPVSDGIYVPRGLPFQSNNSVPVTTTSPPKPVSTTGTLIVENKGKTLTQLLTEGACSFHNP